jgi:hypothetical protein
MFSTPVCSHDVPEPQRWFMDSTYCHRPEYAADLPPGSSLSLDPNAGALSGIVNHDFLTCLPA